MKNINTALLKGAVSRDFLAFFLFHELKPSGPLKNRLKWFCFKIRFCEDIREKFDSAQANTARSWIPRSVSLRRVLPGTIVSVQASPCL